MDVKTATHCNLLQHTLTATHTIILIASHGLLITPLLLLLLCCSVFHCVAASCDDLNRVQRTLDYSITSITFIIHLCTSSVLQCVAPCCTVLQCLALLHYFYSTLAHKYRLTKPREKLLGIQRVSNPPAETQRRSTPAHSNGRTSENKLVRR